MELVKSAEAERAARRRAPKLNEILKTQGHARALDPHLRQLFQLFGVVPLGRLLSSLGNRATQCSVEHAQAVPPLEQLQTCENATDLTPEPETGPLPPAQRLPEDSVSVWELFWCPSRCFSQAKLAGASQARATRLVVSSATNLDTDRPCNGKILGR